MWYCMLWIENYYRGPFFCGFQKKSEGRAGIFLTTSKVSFGGVMSTIVFLGDGAVWWWLFMRLG